MIDRQFGRVIFECDGCNNTVEGDDWDEAHAQFKDERWRAEKVGSEWTHLCPACQRRPSR